QLTLRQRGSHRRHNRLEAGLAQREDVGIPFDDERPVLACDRRPRAIEPVEEIALPEELALRGVHVLRVQRILVVELARLETDHASPRVGEREEETAREVVVAAPVCEAGRRQLLRREPLLPCLVRQRPAARREPESVLAADLLAEASSREVLARERARRRVPEIPL